MNLAFALLVGFHLCLEHAVALFACMQNAESFLAVRNDESLVLPDGCCDDEQRGNDDAHQQVAPSEDVLAVGKEGREEHFGSVGDGDACREDEERGCLPGRHLLTVHDVLACHIEREGEHEHRQTEMVGHEAGEHDVGKGEEKGRQQVGVEFVKLQYLTEGAADEDKRVGGENRHHHSHEDDGDVLARELHLPVVEQIERIPEEWQQRMTELGVVGVPLRHGEIGEHVEARQLIVSGEETPVAYVVSSLGKGREVIAHHECVECCEYKERHDDCPLLFFSYLENMVHICCLIYCFSFTSWRSFAGVLKELSLPSVAEELTP